MLWWPNARGTGHKVPECGALIVAEFGDHAPEDDDGLVFMRIVAVVAVWSMVCGGLRLDKSY